MLQALYSFVRLHRFPKEAAARSLVDHRHGLLIIFHDNGQTPTPSNPTKRSQNSKTYAKNSKYGPYFTLWYK